MATAAENIETAIDQITERIVEVTASAAPDYTENGRTVSKGAYLEQLGRQLDGLVAMRNKISGPFMVKQYGRAV